MSFPSRNVFISLLAAGSLLLMAGVGVAAAAPEQAPSNGHLLFDGSRISDFESNQSAPGAVSEVPDPTGGNEPAFQMTVSNNDVAPVTPTDNPRAQLATPSTIQPGDEFWWSGKFYLPASFPSNVPGWLNVIEGAYGAPFDGTPPFELEVVGGKLRWQRNDTYNWDVPWEMPLERGRWITYLVHQKFSSEGFVELWINGQQVTFFNDPANYNPNHEGPTQRLEMATRDHSNDGGANFLVLQNYRKANMFNSATVYQGPTKVGTSRASVEGGVAPTTILRRGGTLRPNTDSQNRRGLRFGLAQRTSAS